MRLRRSTDGVYGVRVWVTNESMEVEGNLPKVVLVEVESIVYRKSKAFGHWDSLMCHLN